MKNLVNFFGFIYPLPGVWGYIIQATGVALSNNLIKNIFNMTAKKVNFNEKWNEFQEKGIEVLISFLSGNYDAQSKMIEAKKSQVFDNKTFALLYNIIYELCTLPKYNFSKDVYLKYVEATSKYLNETVLADMAESSEVILLKKLADHWDKHVNIFVKWLGKCFRYLDQHYVKQYSYESIADKGESLFKQLVFAPIKIKVYNAIVNEFNKEREGEWIDDYSLKTVIQMIIRFKETIGVDEIDYLNELEANYIAGTKSYCIKKSEDFLNKYNCEEYLHKVDKFIEEEKFRIDKYLKESSFDRFISVVQQELLVKNMNTILNKPSGLSFILNNHIVKDMRLIHKLYSSLHECLKEIALQFKDHISNNGNKIINRLEESIADVEKNQVINAIFDSTFINDIVSFCENYMDLLVKDFKKDSYFATAFDSAFSSFLNRSVCDHSVAEILGRSCDSMLKKGNQILSDTKIYKFIDNITNLFIYMEDKDMFIDVYRWGLAKRLLDNKCASIDYEKAFIGKIKMSWGSQYTSKIEGMLTDTNSETEAIKEFYDSKSYKSLPIEFEVRVLTDGYWPSFKSPPIILPQQLASWIGTFENFYLNKNKMKTLSWSYLHGSWTVRAIFENSKEYDLLLTTYQACIVMLFNSNDKLSFSEIQEMLQTDEVLLKNMVVSLCCKKYKILAKSGEPKSISRSDILTINNEFKSKLKQLAIAVPMIKETFNKEKVDIDRTYAIESAIVKIMKSRKVMRHTELLNEVMAILQMFKPTAAAISNRIEGLIEKEYLEQDSEDSSLYRYLA